MGTEINLDWTEIGNIIERYNRDKECLLMIMQDISGMYNYVPKETIPLLSEKLGLPESLIYSVASFYKTISLEPRGKYIISLCTGTACHVRGADKIMETLEGQLGIGEGETTEDQLFTLESVRCIGCCASGPVMTVNQDTHGGLDRTSTLKIVQEYKQRVS
jgi:NADH-quinone oxidoreductase subunit E